MDQSDTGKASREYHNATYWSSIHARFRGSLDAVGYSGYGERFNRETYKIRLKALKRLLRRIEITPSATLLEAAVGIGAYAPLWREFGLRWTGIDIAETAINDLRNRFPDDRFLTADLAVNCGSLSSELFDVVTAIDVLYHIVDDGGFIRAVKNLAERVRPGGLLVISDVLPPGAYQRVEHVKRRPLRTYETALPGFKAVAREPVFAVLGDPIGHGSTLNFALFTVWRFVSKTARTLPSLGGIVVRAVAPVDAALRFVGISRGRNLELVAFRRVAD